MNAVENCILWIAALLKYQISQIDNSCTHWEQNTVDQSWSSVESVKVTSLSYLFLYLLQVDLHAEELENNVPAEVALLGDLKCVSEQVACLCVV